MSLLKVGAILAVFVAAVLSIFYVVGDRSPTVTSVTPTRTDAKLASVSSETTVDNATVGTSDQTIRSIDDVDKSAHFSRQPLDTNCDQITGVVIDGVGRSARLCQSTDSDPNPLDMNLEQLLDMEATNQPIPIDGLEVLGNYYVNQGELRKGIDWLKAYAAMTGKVGPLHMASHQDYRQHPKLQYELIAILVRSGYPVYEQKMLRHQRAGMLAAATDDARVQLEAELDAIDQQVDTFVNGLHL